MALFPRYEESDDEFVGGSDAATRALSVTAVENDFVEAVYEKLASVYDFTFGPTLHPGRLQAIQRMAHQAAATASSKSASAPASTFRSIRSDCKVTGIDLSESMLREGARARRPEAACATSGCCRWTRPT